MLADQRKQIILDQVNLNHSVTVARLVELLGVSTETVRRDLEDLENNNMLTRVWMSGAHPIWNSRSR